ncbi:uncharacterized protein BX664DRAFT_319261 [Halteromyces radiatus]|uniref:uncharacterized protein n=1 Tax=Halteromyces radiatus TaxID=101107 RepID=UPI00221F6D7C|nr:uncharacterized protein BX664DRAFT_319261 [Halteromyces radiatus]KAI8098647.1 hypothetical protein BX664DRAFT_319261 [Halteromyces radiatus]
MSMSDGIDLDENTKTNNDTNNDEHTFDINIKDLTVQFETNIISPPITQQHDYAHRQGVLRSFQAPAIGNETQLRINKALAWQRMHRNQQTEKARQIALGELDSDEELENQCRGSKRNRDMDEDIVMEDTKFRCLDRPNKSSSKKDYSKFANQVMYAETMENIPSDLLTDWVMMICPKGKRCLVTSGNGQTVARARSGRIINRFQSGLPNGSIQRGHGSSSNYCILDCIYDASKWTFYVLDMMCWNGYAIYDCDTDFRHFWLQTKFDGGDTNKNQLYHFQPLIPVPTTEIKKVTQDPKVYLTQYQIPYDVDGLLFYHRQTQYITGSTPLVCWLPLDNLSFLNIPI